MKETFKNIIKQSCPRILSLLDKNPFSHSYGCFDRKFWQYKIIDFPCGMQQELVLPLTYLWKTPFKDNVYYKSDRIKEYLSGIFSFHINCCHSDGSVDDYFPHERAFGATAYSLAALTEAVLLCGFKSDAVMQAFEKSGGFLVNYRESGLLSNHLAIASTALINLYQLTNDYKWKKKSEDIIHELIQLQDEEGWFPEYEGCDLGYQTVTIEFLARYYLKTENHELLTILKKACKFLCNFLHPDGSLGGEYGSRNTYNFYPGGFAILSTLIPEASIILSYFQKGLKNGCCNFLEDDGVFGHMLSSYVTLLQTDEIICSGEIEIRKQYGNKILYFENSGLFVATSGVYVTFGNTTKGGVYKIFKSDKLIASDTGFVGLLSDGTPFCQNNASSSKGIVTKDSITIKGAFLKYSSNRLSKIQMIGLRGLSIMFGKITKYSNWIRMLMQKILIYKSKKIGVSFERKIKINEFDITIFDKIVLDGDNRIDTLFRSVDCVNMHVVTSDSFQIANLLPWEKMDIDDDSKCFEFFKRY